MRVASTAFAWCQTTSRLGAAIRLPSPDLPPRSHRRSPRSPRATLERRPPTTLERIRRCLAPLRSPERRRGEVGRRRGALVVPARLACSCVVRCTAVRAAKGLARRCTARPFFARRREAASSRASHAPLTRSTLGPLRAPRLRGRARSAQFVTLAWLARVRVDAEESAEQSRRRDVRRATSHPEGLSTRRALLSSELREGQVRDGKPQPCGTCRAHS